MRCVTATAAPSEPDPGPIDIPPPSGPERPAPGVPGTTDPEPIEVPDPPSARRRVTH